MVGDAATPLFPSSPEGSSGHVVAERQVVQVIEPWDVDRRPKHPLDGRGHGSARIDAVRGFGAATPRELHHFILQRGCDRDKQPIDSPKAERRRSSRPVAT